MNSIAESGIICRLIISEYVLIHNTLHFHGAVILEISLQ